jgi:hypothetical protein
MPQHDNVKNERIKLYFDLIVGTVMSSTALGGIIFWAINFGIINYVGWLSGFIFLIGYLALALGLIGIGLYTRYKEKHYDERELRKDLRAPIV